MQARATGFFQRSAYFCLIHPEKVISYLLIMALTLIIILRSIRSQEEIAGGLK